MVIHLHRNVQMQCARKICRTLNPGPCCTGADPGLWKGGAQGDGVC